MSPYILMLSGMQNSEQNGLTLVACPNIREILACIYLLGLTIKTLEEDNKYVQS